MSPIPEQLFFGLSKSVIADVPTSRATKHPDGSLCSIRLQNESFQVTPTGS